MVMFSLLASSGIGQQVTFSTVPSGAGQHRLRVNVSSVVAVQEQPKAFVGEAWTEWIPCETKLIRGVFRIPREGDVSRQAEVVHDRCESSCQRCKHGRTILFNTVVDYRIKGKIWPMLEQNSTFWSGGVLDGKKQVFLLPGRPGF
jgi:hypothetical protein